MIKKLFNSNIVLFCIGLIILCGLTLCSCSINSSADDGKSLKLLSFETVKESDAALNADPDFMLLAAEEPLSKESNVAETITRKAENGEEQILEVVNHRKTKVQAVIRNVERDSFIDLVLDCSWLNTMVVYNEGNGDYTCKSTTIYENEMWVTRLEFDVDIDVDSTGGAATLEIKEINFLHSGNNKIKAELNSKAVRTIDYALVLNQPFADIPVGDARERIYEGRKLAFWSHIDWEAEEMIEQDGFGFIVMGDTLYSVITKDLFEKNKDIIVKDNTILFPTAYKYNDYYGEHEIPVNVGYVRKEVNLTGVNTIVIPEGYFQFRIYDGLDWTNADLYLPNSLQTFIARDTENHDRNWNINYYGTQDEWDMLLHRSEIGPEIKLNLMDADSSKIVTCSIDADTSSFTKDYRLNKGHVFLSEEDLFIISYGGYCGRAYSEYLYYIAKERLEAGLYSGDLRDNLDFKGFFLDENYTEKVVFPFVVFDNIKIYAKFGGGLD